MTYDEVKDQLKLGDYWILNIDDELVIGHVTFYPSVNHLNNIKLGVFFPGVSAGYYPELFNNYVRKLDLSETVQ